MLLSFLSCRAIFISNKIDAISFDINSVMEGVYGHNALAGFIACFSQTGGP